MPRGYSIQNKYGFSTKLSDYLNHQKLVLVTDISDNKMYIDDGVNGFIVPPDNPELMYKKLIYIVENLEAVERTVLPNVLSTSINQFHYKNYGTVLRNFLLKKKINTLTDCEHPLG